MSFLDTVKDSIKNLKTLEIRTVIGNFKWDDERRRDVHKIITFSGLWDLEQ